MFFDEDYVPVELDLLTHLVSSTRKSSNVSKLEIAREMSTSTDSCHKECDKNVISEIGIILK